MSLEEQFGELRSFLEKRPSSQTFDLIIQALEAGAKTNEDRVRAEWLPYAEQRLASWPDHTRLCPKSRRRKPCAMPPLSCRYSTEQLGLCDESTESSHLG